MLQLSLRFLALHNPASPILLPLPNNYIEDYKQYKVLYLEFKSEINI